MKELAAAPALKNVRRLSLSWCSLGDAATEVLLRSPHLVNLRELDLTGNNLSGHLMPLLADQLPRLHTLILTNNRLLDQGMRRLVDHPGATKFRVLNLSSTALSPPGGLALANSPHLDGLAQLTVSGQALGFEASKALRKRFGTRVSL